MEDIIKDIETVKTILALEILNWDNKVQTYYDKKEGWKLPLWLVQKWLREITCLDIVVERYLDNNIEKWRAITKSCRRSDIYIKTYGHESYEIALEEIIKITINQVKGDLL